MVGAAIAVIIGLPALRIRGLFLAASTLAFGLVVSTTVLNRTYAGWFVPAGRIGRPELLGFSLAGERAYYFFVLVILGLILASARSVRRSRLGRVLIGARDNERAARAYGVGVTGARLAAFAIDTLLVFVIVGPLASDAARSTTPARGTTRSSSSPPTTATCAARTASGRRGRSCTTRS